MFSIIQLNFTNSSALVPEIFENFKLNRLPNVLYEIQGHVAFVLGLVYLFQAWNKKIHKMETKTICRIVAAKKHFNNKITGKPTDSC
jgi:hypothetical protein